MFRHKCGAFKPIWTKIPARIIYKMRKKQCIKLICSLKAKMPSVLNVIILCTNCDFFFVSFTHTPGLCSYPVLRISRSKELISLSSPFSMREITYLHLLKRETLCSSSLSSRYIATPLFGCSSSYFPQSKLWFIFWTSPKPPLSCFFLHYLAFFCSPQAQPPWTHILSQPSFL